MRNFFTAIYGKSLRRLNLILEKHHCTSVGVIMALVVVALFFILSGIGQHRVSVFASVELDNPVFASSNDHGTIIVDTGKTRLVFVDSKNELTKIVQVDEGEFPIYEVSRVQLANEGVIVVGSKCTDDGETLASESVLYFSYDGAYMQPLWNAIP